ncbi:hypothetical protein FBU30_009133 [Linnemannia zychae]|nr:hypothetical protein FBU30_009133 [Linnemannia zychae]
MGKKNGNKKSSHASANNENTNDNYMNINNNASSKKVKLMVKNPFATTTDNFPTLPPAPSSSPPLPTSSYYPQQPSPIQSPIVETASTAASSLTAAEFSAAMQSWPSSFSYNPFSDSHAILFDRQPHTSNEDCEDDDDEEDEESVIRARREALAALDPYNVNAHKEHFKSLKTPKVPSPLSQVQQPHQPSQPDKADQFDMHATPPSSLASQEPSTTLNPQEPEESLTLMTISTPPSSRLQQHQCSSLQLGVYSTPKAQIQRPISHGMPLATQQDDTIPEISISLATPSPPSSSKRRHRRDSSLVHNANPALLTTTSSPSLLSTVSLLDEEFARLEATKKGRSNRTTTVYTNLFQRITSFGSSSGRVNVTGGDKDEKKKMENDIMDHISTDIRKDSDVQKSKPASTSWSLKRNTFGATLSNNDVKQPNLSDSTLHSSNQTSRFGILSNKRSKNKKSSRKQGIVSAMSPRDPWDSFDDDILLQGTDDENQSYDYSTHGRSTLHKDLLLKGRIGGRRSSDDTTIVGESDQAIVPRLGKGGIVGLDGWVVHPRTAAFQGTLQKDRYDAVPVPTPPSQNNNPRPASLPTTEYTTISLASPPMTIYSTKAIEGGQGKRSASVSENSVSLSRVALLDSSFYRLKRGAATLLSGHGSSNRSHGNDQIKKNLDQEKDDHILCVENDDINQDPGFDHRADLYDISDEESEDRLGINRMDQRSSSMTFGRARKAISPPPLTAFSSFPSLRDFIHSATGLSRSSTVSIGNGDSSNSGLGNISPPPFSPTAYLRRAQTITGLEGYSLSLPSSSSIPSISRHKNTPAMLPTIVTPKREPRSVGATATLLATPVPFSPPCLSSSSTEDSEMDFLSMSMNNNYSSSRTRSFHRLGYPSPPRRVVALALPPKAAMSTNSAQKPSSLAIAAMAAAQRARTVYNYSTSTLIRPNSSVSVDSMTGPLMGKDYIGQFERDRAQARNMTPNGSSLSSLASTVKNSHASSVASFAPTVMSSTSTLLGDRDNGHRMNERNNMMTNFMKIGSRTFGLGYFNHSDDRSSQDYNSVYNITRAHEDDPSIGDQRQRQLSGQSDITEKLMHLPEPSRFEGICSCRGLTNIASMLLILCGLVLLILGYPIAQSLRKDRIDAETAAAAKAIEGMTKVRYAMDPYGKNNSGLAGLVSKTVTVDKHTRTMMIDPDTPLEKRTTVAKNGQLWDLVFSDEFNRDGRGFGPGQDPHWEAMKLAPSATMGTLEHYSPDQVTTKDGQLEITIQRTPLRSPDEGLHKRSDGSNSTAWKYTSGMLQSWNKMCFQGGILEVAVSLPGYPTRAGFKPRVFVLGNLARYGYPASMDGVYPFSSSSSLSPDCNSTMTTTTTSSSSSTSKQRLAGCSPNNITNILGGRISRGAPEMTLLEVHYGMQMNSTIVEDQKRSVQMHQQLAPKALQRRQIKNMHRRMVPNEETVVLQKQNIGASRATVDKSILNGGVSKPLGAHTVFLRQSFVMASVKLASTTTSTTSSSSSNNISTSTVETSAPGWIQPIDSRYFSTSSSTSSPSSISANSEANSHENNFVKVSLEYWPGPTNTSSSSASPIIPRQNSSSSSTSDNEAYIQFSLNNQRQPPLLNHVPLIPDTWHKGAQLLPEHTVIPQEPMSIVLSLGLLQDPLLLDPELQFPAVMKVDYVRLYQPRSETLHPQDPSSRLTCNPVHHPTATYIRDHLRAYTDAGMSTWAQAGYA